MADRRVNIELNITASAAQAQSMLGGFFGHTTKDGKTTGIMAKGPHAAMLAATIALKDFAARLVDTSVSLSKMANPAQATLYELAFNDLLATIGQRLTPIVEFATEGLRIFGDFLASVLPSSQTVKAAMAPLGEILTQLKNALIALVPLVKDALFWALKQLAFGLAWVAGLLQGLFGRPRAGLSFPASSRGAAARPAQQFGDVNAAIEAMNLSALSGASIPDQQLETQKQMLEILEQINRAIKEGHDRGEALGGKLANPLAHAFFQTENLWAGWALHFGVGH